MSSGGKIGWKGRRISIRSREEDCVAGERGRLNKETKNYSPDFLPLPEVQTRTKAPITIANNKIFPHIGPEP